MSTITSNQHHPEGVKASRIFMIIVLIMIIALTALLACWDSSEAISHISYQKQKMDGVVKVDNSSESSDKNETTVPTSNGSGDVVLVDKQEEESLDEEECTLPELLSFDDPGKVNSLRRTLGLENPDCYAQYLPVFANYTRNRLSKVKSHLSLHIPKTGGTSLCQLARSLNISTPKTNNCFEYDHFKPIWCCYKLDDRKDWFDDIVEANVNTTLSTCDALANKLSSFTFTMNENYLDHALCMKDMIYSVLLRDPIERGLSQERHMRALFHSNNPEVFSGRLNLARNNYMTWAIAVGSTNTSSKATTLPDRELLEVAKSTLLEIDFLLDPSSSRNQKCTSAILNLMDFKNTTLPHANKAKSPKLPQNITRERYMEWSALDIELYEYATKLMELDCNFFLRLENETQS